MIRTIEHVQEREGEYYVVRTRVPVGVIIAAWQRHTPPEQIVEQFPTLTLADVYGVVTYYLDHQQELDAHFSTLREEYERERLRARANDPAFYADLAQRRDAWRAANPERVEIPPNSAQDLDAWGQSWMLSDRASSPTKGSTWASPLAYAENTLR